MRLLARGLIGLLFGLGLIVAGMADPAKVLAFLDLGAIPSGGWDPSLALVMAAATGVAFVGYRLALARPRPRLDAAFHLPAATAVDPALVVGAATFGLGWGLAGYCPGPAVVALGAGRPEAAAFVAALLVGMAGARRLASPSRRSRPAAAS